jgi:hypothetical protein
MPTMNEINKARDERLLSSFEDPSGTIGSTYSTSQRSGSTTEADARLAFKDAVITAYAELVERQMALIRLLAGKRG